MQLNIEDQVRTILSSIFIFEIDTLKEVVLLEDI